MRCVPAAFDDAIREAMRDLRQQRLHDLVLGCLFGSALGDAVGLSEPSAAPFGAVESRAAKRLTILTHRVRRDPRQSEHVPGEWTEIMNHMMRTLLAYLEVDDKALNPNEFPHRLYKQLQQGHRTPNTAPLELKATIGNFDKTNCSLEMSKAMGQKSRESDCSDIAPNSCLMATLPLGLLCYAKSEEDTFQIAAGYCRSMYADLRCSISCVIAAGLIHAMGHCKLQRGVDIDALIDRVISWWKPYRVQCIDQDDLLQKELDLDLDELKRHTNTKYLKSLRLNHKQDKSHVYKCLGAGIYTLRRAIRARNPSERIRRLRRAYFRTKRRNYVSFKKLILKLVKRGGDASANACFAGALLGTLISYLKLPKDWWDQLKQRDWLLEKSEDLCDALGYITYRKNTIEQWEKTIEREQK